MKNNLYKKMKRGFVYASSIAMMSAFAVGCSESGNDVAGGASGDAGVVAIADKQIAGVSQKGPFVKGSSVVLKETSADGDLKPTGKEFFATTRSEMGDFVIDNLNLESQFVRLAATGYYKSETTGENSKCQISLNALSDISARDTVNINIFTHLESGRMLRLVKKGKSFAEAKKQAHRELMESFAYGDLAEDSENLDVTSETKAGRALKYVSSIIDGDLHALQSDVGENVYCDANQEFIDVLADMFTESGDFSGDYRTIYVPDALINLFKLQLIELGSYED